MKIERDVPMPGGESGRERRPPLPLDAMQPGDSFFVEASHRSHWVQVRVSRYAAATGKRFRAIRREEDGKRGFRVWRAPEEKPAALVERDGPEMPTR